jgi:hypothetical protein
MLSDKEAASIERQRREGTVGGPLVLSWVDRLLADRKERVEQLRYLQRRLRQAFKYLDALITNGGELRPPYSVPAADEAEATAPRVICPVCGNPYLRARGLSPGGIAYEHEAGRQCRTPPK